jgi:hypothetical protein
MFSIGAKLLGSFSGAMRQAMTRLQKLQWTARNTMRAIGLMGAALTGLAIGAGITAAGLVLRKIFSGAEAAYKNSLEVQTQLGTIIENNNKLHGIGVEQSKQDVELLSKQAEEMQKVGVNSDEIMLTGAKTLSQFGESPKKVAAWLPIMDDVLAATKGVNASQGDAQVLAMKIGKAVKDGQLMGLKRLGLEMGKLTPKEFKALSTEQKRLKIMTALEAKFKGASARLGATDLGKLKIMNNLFDNLQEKIGAITIGYKVKWAEFLIKLLPRLEPLVVRLGAALGKLFGGADKQGKSLGDTISDKIVRGFEKLIDLVEWLTRNKGWLLPLAKNIAIVTAALYALSVAIGVISAVAALNPLAWVAIAAAAVLVLALNWDTAKQSLDAYVRATEQNMDKQSASVNLLSVIAEGARDAMKGFEIMGQMAGNVWSVVLEGLTNLGAKMLEIGDTAVTSFGQFEQKMYNYLITPTQVLVGLWNNLIGIMNSLPFVNIPKIPTPQYMAAPGQAPGGGAAFESGGAPTTTPYSGAGSAYQLGGIIRRAQTAMVGEHGPEAIIPLSGGRRAAGLLDYANRALGMGARAGPTAVSFAPVITINGNATETEQRAMDSRLRDLASDFIAQFKAAQYQERRLSYEGGYG